MPDQPTADEAVRLWDQKQEAICRTFRTTPSDVRDWYLTTLADGFDRPMTIAQARAAGHFREVLDLMDRVLEQAAFP